MNALSRFPAGSDHKFDGEEMGEDVDNVCTVRMISYQIMQDYPNLLIKEGKLAQPMFRQAPGLQETG